MNKSTKTKLIATIISMVCALALIAVGVMASLTKFEVAVGNQLNLEFGAVEGALYATRVGDVASADRTTSKVLSESTNATSWLKLFDGVSGGADQTNLDSIQEKVGFVSDDKINEIVNGGRTYVAITYYFYYTLPADAVSNEVLLTAPEVANSSVVASYEYIKTKTSSLPSFDNSIILTDGSTIKINRDEHLFIKAEAKVDLTTTIVLESVDWTFTLNFGLEEHPIVSDDGVYTTARPTDGVYHYYIELGEYPQTVVDDETILTALNALDDTAKTGRTFVIGGSDDKVRTTHEEYSYNGAKYVKVASAAVSGTGSQYKFSTGTKATKGNTYWFKVEPIKWYLLEAYSTTKTEYTGPTTNLRVISEQILADNIMFDDSVPDWNVSNIHNWLNDAFYNSAFSTADKGHIIKNTTRYFGTDEYETKDDYTVTTGGSTSEDNVWLPSYYEMSKTYYGTNLYLEKNGRAATPTDFALVNYASKSVNGYGEYWLRSKGGSVANWVARVAYVGSLEKNTTATYTHGVRPALTISL